METLDGAIYVVSEIDGDYAILTPADAPAQAPRQVALALLPDGIGEGDRLRCSLLEYERL